VVEAQGGIQEALLGEQLGSVDRQVVGLRMAVSPAALDHTPVGEEDDRPLVDRRDRLRRRHVDELAAPGGFAGARRGQHRDRRVEADHVAADRGAALYGLALRVAGDQGVATRGEVDEFVAAVPR
jgi:hypothetical protein